jgi:hypothetical protein
MCPYVSRSAVRNLGTVTFLPENIQQGNKYKKECEFVSRHVSCIKHGWWILYSLLTQQALEK